MKCLFKPNSIDFVFQYDKDDMPKIKDIIVMMNSDGWKNLKEYRDTIKGAILNSGKEGIKRKITKELSDLKWARLEGHDLQDFFLSTMLDDLNKLIEDEANLQKTEETQDE